MTIKVSKPAINLREKLNELEQDTGLKGQELMRAETVAEARSLIGAGRKNLIINGGMQVAQRGTSFSAHSGYHLDRYKGFGHDYSRIDNGSFYSLRMTYVSGTSAALYCPVELQRGQLENGQTYTISFKYKGNDLALEAFFRDGTTGSNVIMQISSTGLPDAASFVDYSVTFTASGRVASNTAFNLRFANTTGTGEIANLQLELGSVATEFEHRSYGEELALCQRYYQHWHDGSGAINGNIIWTALSTTYVVGSAFFAGAMRTEPAVTIRATQSATNGTIRKTSDGNVTGSGFTANNISNRSFGFCNYSGSNPPLVVGEDYDFTFKADAEL